MSTFKIGSLTFHQYVGKRLQKDSLGFVPTDAISNSCTDRTTYIKAPIVKNIEDFLAYAHELGHCKSRQKYEPFSASWSFHVSDERIYNEVNAWEWALRYVKKLDLFCSLDDLNIMLNRYLGSYVKNAMSHTYTNELLEKFNRKFGTCVAFATPIKFVTNPCKSILDDKWTECFLPTPTVAEKSSKWKAWHDMQETQARKFWRNK